MQIVSFQEVRPYWIRMICALIAAALMLVLVSCGLAAVARTAETTYTLDGKTYILQEFDFADQHNFTLFQVVDGQREFAAFYEPDDKANGPPVDVFNGEIPEEEGHLRTIMTVAQKGEQHGDTTYRKQDSINAARVFDPDFGD